MPRLLEPAAGTEETGADRADGQGEHLSHLLFVEPVGTQGEDLPVRLGQTDRRPSTALMCTASSGFVSCCDSTWTEVVDVPPVGRGQVLVKVMAAGIDYNNVWSALGSPLDVIAARQKAGATEDFHIGGSDLSGIVWAVGEEVRGV